MRNLLASLILATAAIFGSLLSAPSAHAACVTGVGYNDVLWIRNGPSTSYHRVGSIPYNGCGVRIFYRSCQGHWCRVRYRGVDGWAFTKYLTEGGGGGGGANWGRACVTGVPSYDVLWIRKRPSARSGKIGSIPHNGCGVRVNWNNCRGAWCRVRYRGVRGWAHTRFLN